MALNRLRSILKTLRPKYQTLHLEYPVNMKPRHGHGKPPHAMLNKIISRNDQAYAELLKEALTYKQNLIQIREANSEKDASLPGWNNGFLPGLDIVMLYTIVAKYKPSAYIEIGSGNSTKVVAKAIRDYQLKTKITSIDPTPRAEIDALADTVIRSPLETLDLTVFKSIKAGDIVFVDNSHRMFPNSDATVFFIDIMPSLPEGVIIHIHDIYLPYDYPQFMCDRYYSERYGLAPFILANPDVYDTLMPNYYVSEHQQLNQVLEPLWTDPAMPDVERHGGSYWIKKGKQDLV